jgi:hypothetical protein
MNARIPGLQGLQGLPGLGGALRSSDYVEIELTLVKYLALVVRLELKGQYKS